jgi:release factor glutamine methyltransferase
MYLPAEDTYLLAECALQYRGRWALEIGVGSGAVVRALAQNFENVAGSDIDGARYGIARCRSPESCWHAATRPLLFAARLT